MAGHIIPNDFNFIDKLSPEDYIIVHKLRKRTRDIVHICSCLPAAAASVTAFIVIQRRNIAVPVDIQQLMLGAAVILLLNAALKAWHLFCGGKICGLTYGIVKEKNAKSKLIDFYGEYEIFPWESNDFKHDREKPFRAYVKEFYYIDALLESRDCIMEHICCYKADHDKINVGSRVIVIRFRDDSVIAVPADQ